MRECTARSLLRVALRPLRTPAPAGTANETHPLPPLEKQKECRTGVAILHPGL